MVLVMMILSINEIDGGRVAAKKIDVIYGVAKWPVMCVTNVANDAVLAALMIDGVA